MGSLEFLHRSQWVPRVVDLPRMPNPSSKWISTKYPFSNTQEAFLSLEMLDVQLICWNLATSSNLSFFVWFPKISSKQWNINIHGPNKIHSWLRSYRTHSDIVADDLTRHGHCKRLEQYAVASVMIIQFTNMSRQNALSPVYTNKHMKHTESVRVVFMLMDPLDLFLHDKHSKGFSAQKAVFFLFLSALRLRRCRMVEMHRKSQLQKSDVRTPTKSIPHVLSFSILTFLHETTKTNTFRM